MLHLAAWVGGGLLGIVLASSPSTFARQEPRQLDGPSALERLSDEDLEACFERLLAYSDSTDDLPFSWGYETCLSEMLRRGDERWIAVVERARARWAYEQRSPSVESTHRSPLAFQGDLELWIALRRLEHRPVPVNLVVRDGAVVEVPFPTLPRLELALELAEDESARPSMTRGGSYRSGRFERCRVEAAPGVAAVAPRPWFTGLGGGAYSIQELTPDAEWRMTLDLGRHLAPETPGPFRLRVRYHDRDDIADPEVSIAGRLTVDSAPFELRWTPLVLARADVERVDVAGCLARLDVTEPVAIARTPFAAGSRCTLPESSAERPILAAGWNALPGLLEALADCEAAPERRAWLLGLLFDLTGLVDPTAHPGALHDYVMDSPFEPAEGADGWAHDSLQVSRAAMKVDLVVQEDLAQRWSVLGRLMRVE